MNFNDNFMINATDPSAHYCLPNLNAPTLKRKCFLLDRDSDDFEE